MRVLHLYSGNLYGGIERLLTTLAELRHLAPRMEPEFGLCFRGRLWEELTACGAVVHDLGPVRTSRPWTVWRARRRLASILATGRFDTAVCHACWPHAVFGPAVRRGRVRLVSWVHDALTGRSWIERWAARTPPDLVLANSHFTAGTAPSVFPGVATEVTYPVPAPTSCDRVTARPEVREELGTPADAVVILQASRLERWKGHSVHVEALGRLRDVPGWEAWFAGGPQKPGEPAFLNELRNRASDLGIDDRVRFLGQRSDVPRLMAAADVYCQPNTGPEPFGVVLVEALYAGLPVVTSGFGGGAEVVTEQCGMRLRPGDANEVADSLRLLIADPAARAKLGATGRARAIALCDPTTRMTELSELLLGRSGRGG